MSQSIYSIKNIGYINPIRNQILIHNFNSNNDNGDILTKFSTGINFVI